MDELRERLKKCKEETGVSYKKLAKDCDIPLNRMYAFSGEVRSLSKISAEKLSEKLKELGY